MPLRVDSLQPSTNSDKLSEVANHLPGPMGGPTLWKHTMPRKPFLYLTPPTIWSPMQRHRVTIRALAARMAIPLARVRQRRTQGITCPHIARDWLDAITGVDPGPIVGPVASHPEGGSYARTLRCVSR